MVETKILFQSDNLQLNYLLQRQYHLEVGVEAATSSLPQSRISFTV